MTQACRRLRLETVGPLQESPPLPPPAQPPAEDLRCHSSAPSACNRWGDVLGGLCKCALAACWASCAEPWPSECLEMFSRQGCPTARVGVPELETGQRVGQGVESTFHRSPRFARGAVLEMWDGTVSQIGNLLGDTTHQGPIRIL